MSSAPPRGLTYEVEDRDRGGFYGGAWSGPFFVLTHEPPQEVPDWMTGTFLDEPIDRALARARTAAGERNVAVFGGDVAADLASRASSSSGRPWGTRARSRTSASGW
ncbi:MAG: hypothetical protein M3N56_12270 [Actinomycetota bacterium]|nr:hypothetical protein [Actinomycetota bacterium]